MKLSDKNKILLLVKQSKTYLTAYNVLCALEKQANLELHLVHVYLSQLVRDGFLSMERNNCECCGSTLANYRITEMGLIKLRELDIPLVSVKQFADLYHPET